MYVERLIAFLRIEFSKKINMKFVYVFYFFFLFFSLLKMPQQKGNITKNRMEQSAFSAHLLLVSLLLNGIYSLTIYQKLKIFSLKKKREKKPHAS